MPDAGEYDRRFEWMKRSGQARGTSGSATPTFTSQGYLWGTLEDTSADTATVYGSDQQQTTATIRLGQLPGIAAEDVLIDVGWSEAWKVETARRNGSVERVCDVTRCSTAAPYYKLTGGG